MIGLSGIEYDLFARKDLETANSGFRTLCPDVFNSNCAFGKYGTENYYGTQHNVYWYDEEENSPIRVFQFTTDLGRGDQDQLLIHHPWGPSGTAISGTLSSIATNLNLQSDFRGYRIRITEGPAAGDERIIAKNGVGLLNPLTSGVITVTEPFSEAITNQSKFLLYTGSIYYLGTRDIWSFNKLDIATMVQTRLFSQSTRPLVASDFTDNFLDPNDTPFGSYSYTRGSVCPEPFRYYFSSTVTSATVSSVTTLGKTWVTDNFRRYDIRIVSGTGKGQSRLITSSTSDTITVSPNWTITPDNTSVYTIQPDPRLILLFATSLYSNQIFLFNVETNKFTRSYINISMFQNIAQADRYPDKYSWFFSYFNDDPEWNDENNLHSGKYFVFAYPGYLTVPKAFYKVRFDSPPIGYETYNSNDIESNFTYDVNSAIYDNKKYFYFITRGENSIPYFLKGKVRLNPFRVELEPFFISSRFSRNFLSTYDTTIYQPLILSTSDAGEVYSYLHMDKHRIKL